MNHYIRLVERELSTRFAESQRFKEEIPCLSGVMRLSGAIANSLSLRSDSRCGPVGNVLADGRRTGAASTEERGERKRGRGSVDADSEF